MVNPDPNDPRGPIQRRSLINQFHPQQSRRVPDSFPPRADKRSTIYSRHGVCACCGCALTFTQHTRGDVCDDHRCRHWAVRRRINEDHRRREKARRDVSAQVVQRLIGPTAAHATVEPRALPIPLNPRRITNLPTRRWRLFRDWLNELISRAAAQAYQSSTETSESEAPATGDGEDLRLSIIGQTCATCRGQCCLGGGRNFAYLDVETMVGLLRHHRDLRPRDVLATYLALMGPRTYQDSCVYHTESGCRLPREMRSSTCNNFLCSDLQEVLKGLRYGDFTPTFIVAVEETQAVRAARVDLSGGESWDLETSPGPIAPPTRDDPPQPTPRD